MPSFEFHGDGFESLAASMRDAAIRIRSETTKTVAEVGMEWAAAAKVEASKHSTSIPAAIRLELVPGMSTIHAKGALAVMYEVGNKKSAKSNARGFRNIGAIGPVTRAQSMSGMRQRQGFAHPVFGNKNVWVRQESFPFLRPSLKVIRRSVTKRMEKAWDESLKPVLRDHGSDD